MSVQRRQLLGLSGSTGRGGGALQSAPHLLNPVVTRTPPECALLSCLCRAMLEQPALNHDSMLRYTGCHAGCQHWRSCLSAAERRMLVALAS